METVNARLASLPDLLGYDSPAALAKACGIDPNTLRKAMQGPSKPSFDVLEALTAKNPKLNADWLLHGTGFALKDARALTPAPRAAEPAADYTSANSTEQTLYISVLKEQVADLKSQVTDLKEDKADLKAEVSELRGKPFDSSDAAGPTETPIEPNDPRFAGGMAPAPVLRVQRAGFRPSYVEAAELSE